MSFQKRLTAGVQNCWLSFLDPFNFAIGNNTSAITPGTIRGSYPFIGIQQMPTGIPEGEPVPIDGDDTTLGSILFAAAAPRTFLMNFGQGDQALDALLQGTLVSSEGRTSTGLVDPAHPVYATCSLIVQSRAINRQAGQSGQAAWTGFIYPVVQIQPLNRESLQGRTAGSFRYKAVAQAASHRPWGVTITDAIDGDDGTYALDFDSYNPLTMDAFVADGIVTSWILNKTPAVTAPTTDATRPYVERLLRVPTSVVAATKTMVLPSAYVLNDRGIVLYEYSA